MADFPAAHERRRPRRGSVERPVSGRLYRSAWLVVALPLLVAALSVGKPPALAAPPLPPAFDRASAVALARDLSQRYPDRTPGTAGARGAAQWLREQLEPYGFPLQSDRFRARIPGEGVHDFENLIAVAPSTRSQQAIVVVAHRDNNGIGAGANDNASGTAALIELARAYGRSPVGPPRLVAPAHTIVFLSTDGGAFGALGAQRFAETSPYKRRVVAVVNLDAIAGAGRARLALAGDRPRSPAGGLVVTAASRIAEQTGHAPRRPSALGQLIDLAFPFSLYEQAPFVGRGVPAITITTAGDRPPSAFGDTPDRLNRTNLGAIGRSAQQLLESLDQGLEIARGTSSYVYLGSRVVKGWAIELSLVAMLLPFFVAAVDLFARCRRRRVPLAPAFRSYRSRFALWLWIGAAFGLFKLLGFWPDGARRPPDPASAAAGDWPLLALCGLGALAALGWLLARHRLAPRREVLPEELLAGEAAALLVLGLLAILVVALNPFALIFLLPSLHAWIWLPQARTEPAWARIGVLLLGLGGPLLLLGSFATRFGLGLDAPWYVLELAALGWVGVPAILVALAWCAAAAQLTAVAAGRYAPYPRPAERGLGPIRSAVRRIVLTRRARRRAPRAGPDALEG